MHLCYCARTNRVMKIESFVIQARADNRHLPREMLSTQRPKVTCIFHHSIIESFCLLKSIMTNLPPPSPAASFRLFPTSSPSSPTSPPGPERMYELFEHSPAGCRYLRSTARLILCIPLIHNSKRQHLPMCFLGRNLIDCCALVSTLSHHETGAEGSGCKRGAHPPLKAPTGLRTGNTTSAILREEV
jgi:hypothetical protein